MRKDKFVAAMLALGLFFANPCLFQCRPILYAAESMVMPVKDGTAIICTRVDNIKELENVIAGDGRLSYREKSASALIKRNHALFARDAATEETSD